MKKTGTLLRVWGPLLVAAALMGCTRVIVQSEVTTTTVRAVGYGTVNKDPTLSPPQQRLLAMRASKLDAIRNLVEQVHGLELNGQSTIGAMAMRNDIFYTYLNTFIRGAKVVSVTPTDSETFQTTVELTLIPGFYACAQRPTVATCNAPYVQSSRWDRTCTSAEVALDAITQGEAACFPTPRTVYYVTP
ncbi:MAG: hypothetical protein M0R77_16780 [Gammaproteobacteria bacterium]|nr:hypothetical protein [Gammaproteobacteria bacterium]